MAVLAVVEELVATHAEEVVMALLEFSNGEYQRT
jgi:hypothetical protein